MESCYNAWIVFQWQPDPEDSDRELPCVVGVFDEESKAVAACLTQKHYIFPMVMNHAKNGDPVEHLAAYFRLDPWWTQVPQ